MKPQPDLAPAAPAGAPAGVIDLGRSVPPLVPEVGRALAEALTALAAEPDPGLLLHRAQASGTPRDRAAASRWLAHRLGEGVDAARIVIANGTQIVIRLIVEAMTPPDSAMLAESLSYGVIRQIAALSHVRLVGLPIDEHGLIPEAIEPAARACGARLLYCNPTVQNPTTAIMPPERRRAVAAIARRIGLTIIEDDVLGPLHLDLPPPIAATDPDVTWYIQSTTKSLAHGLRLAYAVAPSADAQAAVLAPVQRLSFWVPAPLGLTVLTRWIETGAAHHILEAVRREACEREALTRAHLGAFRPVSKPGSFHVWLPTGAVSGTDFAARAAAKGVLVRPANGFSVAPTQADPPFVRLSISSPIARPNLLQALEILHSLG